MDYWQAFIRHEYAHEVMMVFGLFLVALSAIKIMSNGFKMVIWVFIATLGSGLLTYGVKKSPFDLPPMGQITLRDLQEIAPAFSSDVWQYLCQKLE